MHRSQSEERLEGGHRGTAAVETESELVEVGLEMLTSTVSARCHARAQAVSPLSGIRNPPKTYILLPMAAAAPIAFS